MESGFIVQLQFQKCRNQTSLPVVAMQDVNAVRKLSEYLQYGAAEKCESFTVVWIILVFIPVQSVAVKIGRVIDQEKCYVTVGQVAAKDLRTQGLALDRYGQLVICFSDLPIVL